MSRFEVYTYTCDQHCIGTFVRKVEAAERSALEHVALTRSHFTNCWVKGCQMPATQARIVKDGDPIAAPESAKQEER